MAALYAVNWTCDRRRAGWTGVFKLASPPQNSEDFTSAFLMRRPRYIDLVHSVM
jgi:hypothetical protein